MNKPTKIEHLCFSSRVLRCLRAADILTIEQLSGWRKRDLNKFRNLGKLSIQEIVNKLDKIGITLID